MNLIKRIENDIRNNPNFKGKIIVVSYTIVRFFRKKVKNKFTLILCAPLILIYKFITDIILGCEIPATTQIGEAPDAPQSSPLATALGAGLTGADIYGRIFGRKA